LQNCHIFTLHNTSRVTHNGHNGIHGMKGTLTITCHLIGWAHVTCVAFKKNCMNQNYADSPTILNPKTQCNVTILCAHVSLLDQLRAPSPLSCNFKQQ
jgi:hypothetical protein